MALLHIYQDGWSAGVVFDLAVSLTDWVPGGGYADNAAVGMYLLYRTQKKRVAKKVLGEGGEKAVAIVTKEAPVTGQIYKRPSNATTKARRQSVQGKPCVDCGVIPKKNVADHKYPLVKEHYETGSTDLDRMRSLDAVQPQRPTCSSKQGVALSKCSKEMKKKIQDGI